MPGPTGAVAGTPITAAHVRDLLAQLDAIGLQTPPGGSLSAACTDDTGAPQAVATLRELRQAARRGCPTPPAGACGCPLIGRPEPTDAYQPTAAQRRFLHTRDRTCRHPGCDNRTGWADADHVLPHANGGATDCATLCCRCRRHHRPKTLAPRLGLRHDPRRDPHGAGTQRGDPHQPATGPAADRAPRPHPTTRPATTGTRPRRRPAALLGPRLPMPRLCAERGLELDIEDAEWVSSYWGHGQP
ncbi:HNH endonuclease signature motif containing protein [Geodermatophilus sp. SYSU D01176]